MAFRFGRTARSAKTVTVNEAMADGFVTAETIGTGSASRIWLRLTKLLDTPLVITIPRGTTFVPTSVYDSTSRARDSEIDRRQSRRLAYAIAPHVSEDSCFMDGAFALRRSGKFRDLARVVGRTEWEFTADVVQFGIWKRQGVDLLDHLRTAISISVPGIVESKLDSIYQSFTQGIDLAREWAAAHATDFYVDPRWTLIRNEDGDEGSRTPASPQPSQPREPGASTRILEDFRRAIGPSSEPAAPPAGGSLPRPPGVITEATIVEAGGPNVLGLLVQGDRVVPTNPTAPAHSAPKVHLGYTIRWETVAGPAPQGGYVFTGVDFVPTDAPMPVMTQPVALIPTYTPSGGPTAWQGMPEGRIIRPIDMGTAGWRLNPDGSRVFVGKPQPSWHRNPNNGAPVRGAPPPRGYIWIEPVPGQGKAFVPLEPPDAPIRIPGITGPRQEPGTVRLEIREGQVTTVRAPQQPRPPNPPTILLRDPTTVRVNPAAPQPGTPAPSPSRQGLGARTMGYLRGAAGAVLTYGAAFLEVLRMVNRCIVCGTLHGPCRHCSGFWYQGPTGHCSDCHHGGKWMDLEREQREDQLYGRGWREMASLQGGQTKPASVAASTGVSPVGSNVNDMYQTVTTLGRASVIHNGGIQATVEIPLAVVCLDYGKLPPPPPGA